MKTMHKLNAFVVPQPSSRPSRAPTRRSGAAEGLQRHCRHHGLEPAEPDPAVITAVRRAKRPRSRRRKLRGPGPARARTTAPAGRGRSRSAMDWPTPRPSLRDGVVLREITYSGSSILDVPIRGWHRACSHRENWRGVSWLTIRGDIAA